MVLPPSQLSTAEKQISVPGQALTGLGAAWNPRAKEPPQPHSGMGRD